MTYKAGLRYADLADISLAEWNAIAAGDEAGGTTNDEDYLTI